jgi:AraC family transcriptional regulator
MNEFDVRIVELKPTRVASVYAFGDSPETAAWDNLVAWINRKELAGQLDDHRIFGFNNPNPSPGSPNYGYEFWMTVGPEIEPEDDVRIQEFSGGLYAVTRCEVKGDPHIKIPGTWKQLVEWLVDSKYKHANHQWLEEHIWPPANRALEIEEFTLDLFAPIAE